MQPSELWNSDVSFGEDPFILSMDAPEVRFSAWDYARERCSVICSASG